MPTVNVDKQRFYEALGTQYTTQEFDELCFQFGIELDEDTTEEAKKLGERPQLKIDIPANRYDMLCPEGISRALLVFQGKLRQPHIRVTQPKQMIELHATESVNRIRPFVTGAVLRGVKFTPENYATFIDLQDKLHQNLARRRTLVSMGTHDLKTVQAPFTYEALPPKDIVFAPLNRPGQEMDGEKLMQVLEADRHLRQYLGIIRDSPVYPVILDKNRTVCSLPPIINGEHSKITLDTRDVFIEMTATDETRNETALNILVAMFSQYCAEPFTVEPIKVVYADGRSHIRPNLAPRQTTAEVSYINSCTGLNLDATDTVKLLQRMGHEAQSSKQNAANVIDVEVPCTRPDVMHQCDLMEDVAVAYGFDNLPRRFPKTNTVGAPLPINKLSDIVRRECAYAGWTEVLPLILCSRDENYASLRRKDDGLAITLENPKTLEFQVVRTSLLPGILKTVRENKKLALPLQTFEVSDVAFKDEETDPDRCARNERHFAAAYYDKHAHFEVVHGLLDHIMRALAIPRISMQSKDVTAGYYLQACEDPTFFPGRAAAIFYRPSPQVRALSEAQAGDQDGGIASMANSLGKALADVVGGQSSNSLARRLKQAAGHGKDDLEIGRIGVLHPEVLAAYDLALPISALELDLEVFV